MLGGVVYSAVLSTVRDRDRDRALRHAACNWCAGLLAASIEGDRLAKLARRKRRNPTWVLLDSVPGLRMR